MARIFSNTVGLALMVAVCGCTTGAPLPAANGAELDPIHFFTGRTHGEGELDKLFGKSAKITVDSVGRTQGDMLILDQAVREGDKPPHARRWTMRRISASRYSGTLTEATGKVQGTVSGSRARIRFKIEHGLDVEQQLALQSDGVTILNRLIVRKFGVRVAILNETIRKLAGP